MSGHKPEIITVSLDPGIRTILQSEGSAFWNNLSPHQRQKHESGIQQQERWLTQNFLPTQTSVHARRARRLLMEASLSKQLDNVSCSFIAVANGLRVLDEPIAPYSLEGLRDRAAWKYHHPLTQLTPEVITAIFKTGEPFDKFDLVQIPSPIVSDKPVPIDMYCLLKKLKGGAVAVLDWPYSPRHTRRYSVDYTHARTLTGFTSNPEGLFFYILDPYSTQEQVYSFRDLVVACLYRSAQIDLDIDAEAVDSVARRAWIIEKASKIQTIS